MKKTIAKFMAAAMLLSAVPAVTMPSFVSKAGNAEAATTTATVSAAQNFVQGGDLIPTKAGEVFGVRVTKNDLVNIFGANNIDTSKNITDILKPSVVQTGNASSAFVDLVKPELIQSSADSDVYTVKVSPKANMTTSEKSTFVNAIRTTTNCFKIKMTLTVKNNDPTTGSETWSDASGARLGTYFATNKGYITYTGGKVYWIGGQYVNGRIEEQVIDDDNLLANRNVYAKIDKVTSDNMAELELIKQANNEVNKLKDNDTLRGRTLNLTELTIGGVKYKVGKLGAQCLKEAKMKKLLAKNVSKVYKGALRKCKQVKTVNMKDKNKIRKINTKAFYNCKNLKHIIIDGRKLNTVGKDSFKGLKKNCTVKIKASKSKFNADVKKIKKANPNAKLKFARIAP